MNRHLLILPLTACLLQAQAPSGPDAGQRRPLPPLFLALDLNQDGVIDASEMAAAATSLLKLDTNGDGMLSPDEYRPPRPGESARPAGPRPEGQARPQNSANHPPRPALDSALDADGDEIISAAEIANAPTSLKKLDLNGDGQLTLEECHPRRAMKPNSPQGGMRPEPSPRQGGEEQGQELRH